MIESFRQQCLSLVLAHGNQTQAGRNDSCKPIVSKCQRSGTLLNAAFKVDDCIGGGSIAVRQRKSISAGFFAWVNRRVERKQTFPSKFVNPSMRVPHVRKRCRKRAFAGFKRNV